ncbi:MAG: c-type cytochrome [Massilia sp.]
MNKWLKRSILLLAALGVLAIGLVVGGNQMAYHKLDRTIALNVAPIDIPTEPERIDQGRYLYATRGCADCHGANGAGKEVFSDGAMLVVAPNITRGANSATTSYKAIDFVRTLRHGVKPSGKPVLIMPSEDYNRLSDEDMADLVAYVQQMPPLPGREAVLQLALPVRVMYGLGMIEDAAAKIDHSLPPPAPVTPSVSVMHGAYVANGCVGCHGAHLSGGKVPGAPPSWPATANLTPGKDSAMVRYPTPEAFMAMMRGGKRPDGSPISSVMPFNSLSKMNDTDLRALHAYLKTLAPLDAGQR